MRLVGLLLLSLLLGCAVRSGLSTTKRLPSGRMCRVSGHVLDASSRQPLAGVPITKNGAQTFTGEDGFFCLNYPASKKESSIPEALDVLGVYSLEYAGRAAIPADTTQRVTVLAVRTAYRFAPRGCLQAADSVHRAPCASPWRGIPGTQRAFLIRDSLIGGARKLRALTFRIGRGGFEREPFRIRLYRYTGATEEPGEDLFTDTFLACSTADGLFTYDLSAYAVVLPATGFFVALEYMIGGGTFFCNDPVVRYTPSGPLLRPPCAFTETRTWTYDIGKGWHRATPAENCWPLYESALSVELEPPPYRPGKH